MSFCGKCGAENDGNAKFCKKCGAPLGQTPVNESANPKIIPMNNSVKADNNVAADATPKKATQISPKLIAGICAAAAVVIAIIFFAMNATPTININKYLTIETEGYDGYGKARVNIDWDAIEAKYGSKIEYTKNAKKEYGELIGLMTPIEGVRDAVDVDLDTTNKLTNGDEIKYTINVDEQLGEYINCKIKYKDGTHKVSGLSEIGKFDAFADVAISFSGIAPNGSAEFNYGGSELSYYDFSMDNNRGLSNGDKVIVSIDENQIERCAEQYGKVPESLEKEYTVEGLNSFVTKSSEITEDVIASMKSQAEDAYYAHAAKSFGDGEEVKGLTYIGNYLLTNKGNSYSNYNYLYLIYKVDIHNSFSNKKQTYDKVNNVYWFAAFSDLMVDGDGNVTVDTNDYDTPNNRFTIDSKVGSGWFGTKSWYYYGYESLDALYKAVVTSNLDAYNHEDNIDESAAPIEEVKEPEFEENADYVLPNSDSELITEADLEGFDAEKCKIARNEIYARHGRKFKDEELQAYFDSKDWYEGTIDPDDFQESALSDIEIKNKDVIVNYEKEKGFR